MEEILNTIENSKNELVTKLMADFDKADLNKDGVIDFSEYMRLIWGNADQNQSTTLRQIRKQFNSGDKNKDGKISREEFFQMCLKLQL